MTSGDARLARIVSGHRTPLGPNGVQRSRVALGKITNVLANGHSMT
jgi:hypothetical protein